MIILPEPNNDLWIYDEEEYYEKFDYSIITKRKNAIELIPQHEYKDFCHLLTDKDTLFIPRKLTRGHWNANFEVTEIFDSLCIRKRKIDNIYIYQMDWGEIFMLYEGADSGGYDVERRFMVFKNIGEYNLKFYLL